MSANLATEDAPEVSRNGSSSATRRAFVTRQEALAITEETPVARDDGGRLYTYREGHYRPGGEKDIRHGLTQRFGDDWSPGRADSTIAFIRDSAPAILDEPPRDLLNVRNGILDLETGRILPHTPEFRSPVQLGAHFDPDAECPAFEKFLGEVLDAECALLIYEITGYLLIPDQSLQRAFMLLGQGANGKSTMLRVWTDLLGAENVSNVALHRLDEDRFAPAELVGKLANVFADLDARALQASSMFKSITGGDSITAERKYANPFSFRPYARLLYSANEPPPTPDSSDAFFRRWEIIPFERRFDGKKADRRLVERLTTPSELSGLLNRGLLALPALRERNSFLTTEATDRASKRFRVDSDSVAGFLADACEAGPECTVPKPRLFPAYREWCFDNNRKPLSKQRFNRHIESLNPSLFVTTVQGTETWNGLALREGV